MTSRPAAVVSSSPSYSGTGESEIIEEAVRRDLGLDLMERLWARNDMAEEDAMELALEAQQKARREAKR